MNLCVVATTLQSGYHPAQLRSYIWGLTVDLCFVATEA